LWCCQIDQISIEELDIISQLPHCVPISAGHNWNMDELIDKVRHANAVARIVKHMCIPVYKCTQPQRS
jgi:ribosome-interacting GTPase 1